MAGAQDRAVPDRAGGAQHVARARAAPTAAASSWSRCRAPDVIHQYEQACLMAGVARRAGRPLDVQRDQRHPRRARSAPAGDWLLVHVTDTYLTLAVMRDSALLFFRNRGEEAEGTLADLIHQTAMYYEDRLHGGGFARVLIAGAARLPGGAESVRRGLEERLRMSRGSRWIRAARRRCRIASAPRRSCSTCWRRWSACCCANGRWRSDAAHQPLDAALLQRSRGARRRSARWRALAVGLTLFNAYRDPAARARQSRDARQTDRAERGAGARAARARPQVIRRSIDQDEAGRRCRSAAREANALIDRRAFSWTELLNQFQATLPPDVRIGGVHAANRQRGPQAGADLGVLAARRGPRGVHGRARKDRRLLRGAAAQPNSRRRRHAALGAAGATTRGAAARGRHRLRRRLKLARLARVNQSVRTWQANRGGRAMKALFTFGADVPLVARDRRPPPLAGAVVGIVLAINVVVLVAVVLPLRRSVAIRRRRGPTRRRRRCATRSPT